MYNLFGGNNARNKSRVIDPSFISIARTVKNNQPIVSNRLVNQSNFVKPDNLLLKILAGLAIPTDLPEWQLDRYVRKRTAELSLSLNVTSVNSYGTTFKGQITPNGTESILLTNETYVQDDWKDLEPVTFMYHTNTNLNYVIGVDDIDSISLVKINVTMLVMQHRAWRKWCSRNDVLESTSMFIAKYAIKNSIRSYMDISLFNLHYHRVAGYSIPDDTAVRGISLPDITSQLTKSNIKIIGGLLNKNVSVGYALFSTPCFFKESALDLTIAPKTISTQQINWFVLVSNLSFLYYGLLLASKSSSAASSSDYSTLARELRSFLGSRVIDKQPVRLAGWTKGLINNIMELIT